MVNRSNEECERTQIPESRAGAGRSTKGTDLPTILPKVSAGQTLT